MRKRILFALALGVGTIVNAQVYDTKFSVNGFDSPTGTVYIDGTGNGLVLTTVTLNITNNDDHGYTFYAGSSFTYNVKMDGALIEDPDFSGSNEWVKLISLDFAANTTQSLTLTNSWAASTLPGTHQLCASLQQILVTSGSTPMGLYSNVDANKEFCADFAFDWATSVEDLSRAEISKIVTNGDVMTVMVKNTSSDVTINIMSITGQMVKTVTPNAGGQNFYQDIDISDLTAGVYIVTIQTENGISAAQKVFVQ